MRILMINVVCGTRSTGRVCTDIAAALQAEGHQVKIAYARDKVPSEFGRFAVQIGTEKDVKYHSTKARLFDLSGFGSKKATKEFLEFVEVFDPQIIHLHNVHGYYIHVKELFDYLKKSGRKVVWTMNDSWAFSGHSPHCEWLDCEKWKTGCGKCPLKGEYPRAMTDGSKRNRKAKKKIFSGVPNLTVVTQSEWLKAQVKSSFLSQYPVEVIRTGIRKDVFKKGVSAFRERYGLTDKKIVLGVAPMWDSMKGYPDFLWISRYLPETYQVVMVGLTKTQIATLPKTVLGLEKIEDPEALAEIYRAADVLCDTAYCEHFPQSHLEAISSGTPVLTYDFGGAEETVTEESGIVVPKGDVVRMAEEIKAVCEGEKPLHAEPDDAKCPDIASFQKAYLSLYKQVLNSEKKE